MLTKHRSHHQQHLFRSAPPSQTFSINLRPSFNHSFSAIGSSSNRSLEPLSPRIFYFWAFFCASSLAPLACSLTSSPLALASSAFFCPSLFSSSTFCCPCLV